jgi:hypothetical protein
MKATPLTQKSIATIGQEIGQSLGKQMVADYQIAHKNDVSFYVIGKEIINQILSQPGCEGIRFYNAYNEVGEKTLVYTGINKDGKVIATYTLVNSEGVLETKKGIVADRAERGGNRDGSVADADNWNWDIQ